MVISMKVKLFQIARTAGFQWFGERDSYMELIYSSIEVVLHQQWSRFSSLHVMLLKF